MSFPGLAASTMPALQSRHANDIHQLVVAVSQHFWITKDETVKYQKKPLGLSLTSARLSPKAHVVVYLIRDDYSGLYYCMATTSQSLVRPATFLAKAWSLKVDSPFSGRPQQLVVPRDVEFAFPGTRTAAAELGVDIADGSPHQAARELEYIESLLGYSYGKKFHNLVDTCRAICAHSQREPSRVVSYTKGRLWQQHLPA
jgi:hypothetical protein